MLHNVPVEAARSLSGRQVGTGRDRAALAATQAIGMLSAAVSEYRLRENPPDLLLRPDLGRMAVMDMARLPEAIAAGERMAEEHLEEIRRLAAGACRGGS